MPKNQQNALLKGMAGELDPEIIELISDPVRKEIIGELLKASDGTKDKFSAGLDLIINKGMDVEKAMEKSGFPEAFKEDRAKQKKIPEIEGKEV